MGGDDFNKTDNHALVIPQEIEHEIMIMKNNHYTDVFNINQFIFDYKEELHYNNNLSIVWVKAYLMDLFEVNKLMIERGITKSIKRNIDRDTELKFNREHNYSCAINLRRPRRDNLRHPRRNEFMNMDLVWSKIMMAGIEWCFTLENLFSHGFLKTTVDNQTADFIDGEVIKHWFCKIIETKFEGLSSVRIIQNKGGPLKFSLNLEW